MIFVNIAGKLHDTLVFVTMVKAPSEYNVTIDINEKTKPITVIFELRDIYNV